MTGNFSIKIFLFLTLRTTTTTMSVRLVNCTKASFRLLVKVPKTPKPFENIKRSVKGQLPPKKISNHWQRLQKLLKHGHEQYLQGPFKTPPYPFTLNRALITIHTTIFHRYTHPIHHQRNYTETTLFQIPFHSLQNPPRKISKRRGWVDHYKTPDI